MFINIYGGRANGKSQTLAEIQLYFAFKIIFDEFEKRHPVLCKIPFINNLAFEIYLKRKNKEK